MTMTETLNLQAYTEGNRIEAKRAKSNLPNSIWETYSSFANTDGGIILLGVEENADHSLKATGVDDVHKLQTDFWNLVNNNQKVSINLLTSKMVSIQKVEDKTIVMIRVPKADRRQRPVYVGLDPMKGTYRRDFEGDHLCTSDEVAAMYRDASETSLDSKVLKSMDWSVFDMDTVHRYRNRFRLFHPVHIWNDEDDEVFLRRIGAMAVSEEDMQFHPTAAGLLTFGREFDIVREFPHYFIDYREQLHEEVRWTHRMVSSSGEWSGNLYDFFFRVYPRITADLPVPFITNGKDRIDETVLHLALREVLLNTCAHADHYGRQGIVIVRTAQTMTFSNPGDIRIGLKAALAGGISDPRNATIMKMFALVDIGERAGMGIPDFMRTWAAYTESTPSYQITQNPARTTLVVPYSQAVLQKAGQQLSKIMGQSTSETSQSTPKSTQKGGQSTSETSQSTPKSTQKGGQSTSDTTQSTQKSTQKGWQSTSETAQSTPKSTKKGGQSTSETAQSTPKSTQKGGQSTSDTAQSTQKSTQKGRQSTSDTAQSTPKSTQKGRQSTSKSTQKEGQSTSEGKLSAATVAILEIIRQNPRVTYEEIAATTGKARSGIAKHIKKLQEKGFLKPKDKQGLWTVVGVAKKEA